MPDFRCATWSTFVTIWSRFCGFSARVINSAVVFIASVVRRGSNRIKKIARSYKRSRTCVVSHAASSRGFILSIAARVSRSGRTLAEHFTDWLSESLHCSLGTRDIIMNSRYNYTLPLVRSSFLRFTFNYVKRKEAAWKPRVVRRDRCDSKPFELLLLLLYSYHVRGCSFLCARILLIDNLNHNSKNNDIRPQRMAILLIKLSVIIIYLRLGKSVARFNRIKERADQRENSTARPRVTNIIILYNIQTWSWWYTIKLSTRYNRRRSPDQQRRKHVAIRSRGAGGVLGDPRTVNSRPTGDRADSATIAAAKSERASERTNVCPASVSAPRPAARFFGVLQRSVRCSARCPRESVSQSVSQTVIRSVSRAREGIFSEQVWWTARTHARRRASPRARQSSRARGGRTTRGGTHPHSRKIPRDWLLYIVNPAGISVFLVEPTPKMTTGRWQQWHIVFVSVTGTITGWV